MRCQHCKGTENLRKNSISSGGAIAYICKECIAFYYKRRALKRRLAVLEIMGNRCVNCGFNDGRALQIDHINGGGSKEKRILKLPTITYHELVLKSVLNKENKYQLLCANCNWIKRYENNEIRK